MSFEWLNIDEKELNYHLDQYNNPKQYTKELLTLFDEWELEQPGEKIIDLGCGGGAVTNLFAKKYPELNFKGVDINPNYIAIADSRREENASFQVLDIYSDSDVDNLGVFEGLLSLQTLSWLPNYDAYLNLLKKGVCEWSLVTSLFYDGPVDAEIKIKDYTRSMGDLNYRECFYNIYSLDIFRKKLNDIGYDISISKPFDLGFDLPKPEDKSMSTYTENTINNNRIQISGPILMSWYTVLIVRIK